MKPGNKHKTNEFPCFACWLADVPTRADLMSTLYEIYMNELDCFRKGKVPTLSVRQRQPLDPLTGKPPVSDQDVVSIRHALKDEQSFLASLSS